MEISTRTPARARFTVCALDASTIGAGFLLATLAGNAQAIDVDAGEYSAALPAGSNIGLLYLQHAERRSLYSDGDKVAIKAGLDSDIGILRVANYQQLGDYTINTQFLLPFGRLEGTRDNDALGQTSGTGDLILASTLWLVNDPAKNRYWGIAPYLFVPTGSYDHNDILNLGENRWKMTLQTGYVTGLTEKLSLDLTADVTVFGKNDDFTSQGLTLRQKPLWQAQTYLRYAVTPKLSVHVGASQLWGGESRIDGQDQGDEPGTSKYRVGGSYWMTPTFQALLNYGQDVSVDNGFKEEQRVNLRLLWVF
ncbi:protein involved in meta-pathway of phenol degradation [Pseudomonas sp. GM78]|uniref:transporter n=1 Tax=Pseudomonas sp. GM78 TaxID=1144337 RepID=UPI0002706A77|nr:protein involved in meta-pathway of phenol degradation [Pseudomonas sp. GM78]